MCPTPLGTAAVRQGVRPLRSALEPWMDTRTRMDKMRDQIRDRFAARARDLVDF